MKSSDFIQFRFPLKYRYIDKRKRHRLTLDAFNTLERIYIIMQDNYTINQLSLAMVTDYQPEKIIQLITSINWSKAWQFLSLILWDDHLNMIRECF